MVFKERWSLYKGGRWRGSLSIHVVARAGFTVYIIYTQPYTYTERSMINFNIPYPLAISPIRRIIFYSEFITNSFDKVDSDF